MGWRYRWRRLQLWWLHCPEWRTACLVSDCPEPRVGVTKFCRAHCDAIFAGADLRDWQLG